MIDRETLNRLDTLNTVALRTCGWCMHQAHLELIESTKHQVPTPGSETVHTAAFRCSGCARISVAIWAGSQYSKSPEDGQIIEWVPLKPMAPEFEDIPSDVASSAREAHIALSVGATRAASIMARVVIEATARDKGITDGGAQAKIDELVKQRLIRPDIADSAHEVRMLANEIAHADITEALDSTDAELALEIMDEVLREVYQGPARLARLKASREGQ